MIYLFELRIGNKVNETFDHVCNIGRDCLVVKGATDTYQIKKYSYGDLTPIPLTPEILEKAGFKKDGAGFKKTMVWWVHQQSDGTWSFGEFYMGHFASLKYVHQLQNLYFALTGEELNIEL